MQGVLLLLFGTLYLLALGLWMVLRPEQARSGWGGRPIGFKMPDAQRMRTLGYIVLAGGVAMAVRTAWMIAAALGF